MADSFCNLQDEAFPSFLDNSVGSIGRATLGNVTLGSGPGLPVAASTVAKIRDGADNRWVHAHLLGGIWVEIVLATHTCCVICSNTSQTS